MSNHRACCHTFNCWYRVDGQCCHSLVEDFAACRGFQPVQVFVSLNVKRVDPPVAGACAGDLNQPARPPFRRLIAG
jgi:hypothetical protein